MEGDITPYEAVRRIENDRMLLPGIQREFVWGEADIIKLFDSLLSGYPINSILLWHRSQGSIEGDEILYGPIKHFSERKVSKKSIKSLEHIRGVDLNGKYIEEIDAPVIESRTHEISPSRKNDLEKSDYIDLIIDGQQRLTALNIGLRGSLSTYKSDWSIGENLYIDVLSDKNDTGTREINHRLQFKGKSEDLIKSSGKETSLWVRLGFFYDKYKNMTTDKMSNESTSELKLEIDRAIKKKFGDDADNIDYNTVDTLLGRVSGKLFGQPLLHEDMKLNAEEVLEAFIRINKKGETLSESEMFLSILTNYWSENGVNAKRQINSYVDYLSENYTDVYALNTKQVLKSIAICVEDEEVSTDIDIDSLAKNVDKISPLWEPEKDYKDGEVQAAIEETISLLRDKFNIPGSKIGRNTVLYPFVYYFFKNTKMTVDKLPDDVLEKMEYFTYLAMIDKSYVRRFYQFESELTTAIDRAETSKFPLREMEKKLTQGDHDFTLYLTDENITNGLQKKDLDSSAAYGLFRLMYYPESYLYQEADHLHPASKFTEENVEKDSSIESWEVESFVETKKDSVLNLEYLFKNRHEKRQKGHEEKKTKPLTVWLEDKDEDYFKRHYVPENSNLWKFGNINNFFDERRRNIAKSLIEDYGQNSELFG